MATPADRSLVGVEGWEKRVCQATSPRWGSTNDSDGFVEVNVAGRMTASAGCLLVMLMTSGNDRTGRLSVSLNSGGRLW